MEIVSPGLMAAALQFARMGIVAFPLSSGGIPMMEGWPDLPADETETRQRFLDHPRARGVGAVCGRSFFVIDLDRNHKDGADGVASMRALLDELGIAEMPPGPRARTGRAGLHMWHHVPDGMRIKTRCGKGALRPGLEIKGARSFVVCPPSIKNGLAYRWITAPWNIETPAAPAAFLDLLREPPERPRPPVQTLRLDQCTDAEKERRRRYIECAINRELRAIRNAADGARNDTLLTGARAAAQLIAGEPDFAPTEATVRNHLLGAARACGLSTIEAEKTIASAFRWGLTVPRGVPPPQGDRARN